MRTQAVVLSIALAAACGGGSPSGAGPASEPGAVVDQFMRAVADSNLDAMASLWGTSRGSAAETRTPSNYQQRVAVMYLYLKGSRARVLADVQRSGDRAVLQVEVNRPECRKQIPFTMVRTSGGRWLIEAIEMGQLGPPGRPCPTA